MLTPILGLAFAAALSADPPPGDKLPPGPPWKTTWAAAQDQAIARHQPIFVYFTKTV